MGALSGKEAYAAPGAQAKVYEDQLADSELLEMHQKAQAVVYENFTVDECTSFMAAEGCAWTQQWNCPGQEGGEGRAKADDTTGYRCCCEREMWKQPEHGKPNANGFWSSGNHKNITVYHQTSPEVCQSIMASNFIVGKGGLCGKAMYFALSPGATAGKAITEFSHGGCMIEAVVDVGKQAGYYWQGGPDRRFRRHCGGYSRMTASRLHATGVDSIVLRQYDGDECVVFEPERVLSKRIIPFKCSWMCRGRCHKHWPSNCRHRR